MTSFYLAGKISKNGWRHEIVDSLCRAESSDYHNNNGVPPQWNPLSKSIFGIFDYTGPYFASCDHGCLHQTGTHTWGAIESCQDSINLLPIKTSFSGGCDYYEYGGHGHKATGCPVLDDEWEDDDCQNCKLRLFTEAKPRFGSSSANYVISNCKIALVRADIVFVWLDAIDAYGTFVETGIAYMLKKQIWIATPSLNPEMWFAYNLADKVEVWPTAKEALWNMTADLRKAESVESKIESPIEQMFWDAAGDTLPGLEPQVKIGRYRVDFALPEYKVVIELDGHDFHKTKEQRTNDAKRERFLQGRGWTVIRFTGTEVFKNAAGCVLEVKEILSNG